MRVTAARSLYTVTELTDEVNATGSAENSEPAANHIRRRQNFTFITILCTEDGHRGIAECTATSERKHHRYLRLNALLCCVVRVTVRFSNRHKRPQIQHRYNHER